MERLDEAVLRVHKLKDDLGLFDNPYSAGLGKCFFIINTALNSAVCSALFFCIYNFDTFKRGDGGNFQTENKEKLLKPLDNRPFGRYN